MAIGKDYISVIEEPKIPLKELWAADDSELNEHNVVIAASKVAAQGISKIGADTPFLKINNVLITEIDYLEIDETSNVPRIKAIFTDVSGSLSGPNYPKNDPILSVYIKTQNENFKPIRCDFLITRIKTNQDALKSTYNSAEFIMQGELFIPKIYNNVSKSYPNLNSKDTLKTLATDTGLGFATNEFSPKDDMTWINTNTNGLNFIKHVTKHSYMDDDSFFTSFIDKYYHLNFINVAEQLNPTHEVTQTFSNTADGNAYGQNKELEDKNNSGENTSEILTFVGLTNKPTYKGRPEYIINYSLMGDTGSVLKNKGFKKKIYYYDHQLEKDDRFTSFFVNPIKIKGYPATSSIVPLEPADESLKESIIKKWMNIDYGNTHREWNASVLINDHNNSELNKVKLKVETRGINFGIVRGAGIPVMIYHEPIENYIKDYGRNDKSVDGEPEKFLTGSTPVKDDILTGKYYVSGVKYIYDRLNSEFPFKTELQLSRFNWMVENNILTDA